MSSSHLIALGIVCYAIFMVSHGMVNFKKTSKSAESFFNADRGVSSFVLVCTTAISVYSGLSYYGYPSSSFANGVGYAVSAGCAVSALMFCAIGYRLWILGREYGFQTPSDFIRGRYYSDGFALFVAVLLIIFIIPYVAVQLMTIGSGIEITTSGVISYLPAVLLGTICVSLHIIGGGMKSVAWLDTFHMILGYVAVYGVIIYMVIHFFPEGGLIEAAQAVASNPETADILTTPGPNGTYTWQGTLNQAVTAAVATIVWPHIFMRCYIAKSSKNFRVMSWSLPLAHAALVLGLMIIGMLIAPVVLGADFTDIDNVLPTLVTQYCPPFIAFLSVLCLFAFSVSTADSFLLSASAIASRDIYVQYLFEKNGKKANPQKVVKFGRIVLIVLMIACIIVTMTKSALITEYAYKLSSPFFATILPCTIGGLFWKRGTKEGAIAGTVTGTIVTVIFTFFVSPPLGLSALIWALMVNTFLYVVVSLNTKVPDEIVDKYINRVDRIIAGTLDISEISQDTLAVAKAKSNC